MAKSKEWNCWERNGRKSHNRRTWSIGHDLTRKFRHVRIDRCISVHGLFPFNPAALQVREELVSRGTALCYRANLATERPPAEPALPCLSTHPPIYSSTHSRTHRRVYEHMYTYVHIYVHRGRWESTSTDIKPIPCFHAALHCLSRAGWDPPWKEASR